MNEFDYIKGITTEEMIEEAQRLTQKTAEQLDSADLSRALYHLALMREIQAKAGGTEDR